MRACPSKRESAWRFDCLNLDGVLVAALEVEVAVAARSQVELRLVAEPMHDLIRLGHAAPDHVDRRLDQDFAFDLVRKHDLRILSQPSVARPATICNQSLHFHMFLGVASWRTTRSSLTRIGSRRASGTSKTRRSSPG